MKTHVHRKTCTKIFMATLFRIPKQWTGEWISKLCQSFISAIKLSNQLIHTVTWMNHKNIILNNRGQMHVYLMCNSIYEKFWNRQHWSIIVEISRVFSAGGGFTLKGMRGLAGVMEVFHFWIRTRVTQLSMFVKTHRTIQPKCAIYCFKITSKFFSGEKEKNNYRILFVTCY